MGADQLVCKRYWGQIACIFVSTSVVLGQPDSDHPANRPTACVVSVGPSIRFLDCFIHPPCSGNACPCMVCLCWLRFSLNTVSTSLGSGLPVACEPPRWVNFKKLRLSSNVHISGQQHLTEQRDAHSFVSLLWYTGWPKKLAHFFVRLNYIRLNFIKYWPIFKFISLSESGEHL